MLDRDELRSLLRTVFGRKESELSPPDHPLREVYSTAFSNSTGLMKPIRVAPSRVVEALPQSNTLDVLALSASAIRAENRRLLASCRRSYISGRRRRPLRAESVADFPKSSYPVRRARSVL